MVHDVTLDYTVSGGNERIVQPPTIRVSQGDTIRFKRGSIPPGMAATIIFTEPEFFSTATFDEGGPDVRVVAKLTHRTSYQCGLKVNGQLMANTLSGPTTGGGGDID